MATYAELMAALRKADAAGDTAGATRLAQLAKAARQGTTAPPPQIAAPAAPDAAPAPMPAPPPPVPAPVPAPPPVMPPSPMQGPPMSAMAPPAILQALGVPTGPSVSDVARAIEPLGSGYVDVMRGGPRVPPVAGPVAASDPFAGEGMGALLARRGQQFAVGAGEVIASIPEALAIQQADRADMNAQVTQRILGEQGPPAPPINAGSSPLFKAGDLVRDALTGVVGTPDPRDTGFWSQVAQGGGNMTGMIGASIAGGLVGGPRGAMATGAMSGAALNAPSLYKEAIAAGAEEGTARAAAQWGAAIGASEIIPINRALRLLPPRLRGEITNGFLKRFTDIAQGSGEEAAQEYLATVANNIVAQQLFDPERGWTEGATDAALVGAVLGGGVAAIGTGAEAVAARRPQPQPDPAMPPDPIAQALGLPVQPPAPTAAQGGTAPAQVPPAQDQGFSRAETEVTKTPPPVPGPITRAEAEADPDQWEIMPQVEGTGRDAVEVPGDVAVNKQTGEARPVVDAAPAPAPTAAQGGTAPAQVQPDPIQAALGIEPAAPAAQPAPPAPSPSNRIKATLQAGDVEGIQTDPKTFQYKATDDKDGVTGRLSNVKNWDADRAGVAMIYEYADGRRVIVDGHQRLDLAKRLAKQGQAIEWDARILREVDGVTPKRARILAALKNISEGSGTVTDTAKVLRDTGQTAAQLDLPRSGTREGRMIADAEALATLSDNAFGMVTNGTADERDGILVAQGVKDQKAQADILGLLVRLQKDRSLTRSEAEAIIQQANAATVDQQQDSLFGAEMDTKNLWVERSKVLATAARGIRQRASTYKTLVDKADIATAAGNVLAQSENEKRARQESGILATLTAEANRKGPISDALTAAAKALNGGERLSTVVERFLDAVRAADAGRPEVGQADAEGSSAAGAGPSGQPQAVDPPEAEPGPDLFGNAPPPAAAPATQPDDEPDMFGAVPQAGKTPEQVKAEAEAATKAAQSKKGTTTEQVDAGPLFGGDQGDMLGGEAEAAPPAKTFKTVKEWASAVLTALKAKIERERTVNVVVSRERILKLTKPKQVDTGMLAGNDAIYVRSGKAWLALGINEADTLAQSLGLPTRFEAVPPVERPKVKSQTELVEDEAERQKVTLTDEQIGQIVFALPNKPTAEQIAAAVRIYAMGGEIIDTTKDAVLGKNAAGEEIRQRPDGTRYAMRFDRKDKPDGRPDFGGDLVIATFNFPTTLEEIADTPTGPGRLTHLTAEYGGKRYYLASVTGSATTAGDEWRAKYPGVSIYGTDRADGTSINGGVAELDAAVAAAKPAPPADTADTIMAAGRNIVLRYQVRGRPKTPGDLFDTDEHRDLAGLIAKAEGFDARAKVADEWVRKKGRESGTEYLVALNEDGVPVGLSKGQPDGAGGHNVVPSQDLYDMAAANEVEYLTHNHPRETALSYMDITQAGFGFGRIVAIGSHRGGRHEMRFPFEWVKKDPRIIRDVAEQVWGMFLPIAQANFSKNRDQTRADAILTALLNLAISRETGIEYSGPAYDILKAEGVDFDVEYDARAEKVRTALRRAGLPVTARSVADGNRPDQGDQAGKPGGNQDAGAGAGGTGIGEGQGPRNQVRVKRPSTGNTDADDALDALFGSDDDVSGTGDDLESGDAGGGTAPNGMGGTDVQPGTGSDADSNSGRTGSRGGRKRKPAGGSGVSGDGTAAVGGGGDQAVSGGGRSGRKPAGGGVGGGRAGSGAGGLPAGPGGAGNAAGSSAAGAPSRLTAAQRLAALRNSLKEDAPWDFLDGLRGPDSPAFKRWFGQSKVVDDSGRPLVVYHGTGADFEAFDPAKIGATFGDDSAGFFLTNNPGDDMASGYATMEGSRQGGNVIPAYVSLQRPYTFRDYAWSQGWSHAQLAKRTDDQIAREELDGRGVIGWWDRNKRSIIDDIQRDGHDGVLLKDPDTSVRGQQEMLIVAFRPTQIKSVFNRGTFDPNDARMLREDPADFDVRRYEMMQPVFTDAVLDLDAAKTSNRDAFIAIFRPLMEEGMTRAEVAAFTPYAERFIADWKAGRIVPPEGDLPLSDWDRLIAVHSNWTATSGMLTNPDPTLGGIIDKQISSGKWFVILNGSDKTGEGFDTRTAAIDWFVANVKSEQAPPAKPPKIVPADADNIAATVPQLLPEQRDDVVKIETRFAKPDGHGFLITNGTGTGKTYTGMGVIKRSVMQGKGNILILAPSQQVLNGWVKAGAALGVDVSILADTKDAGSGVVATTYANFYQNNALVNRQWDMLVPDESQELMSNKTGDTTKILTMFRALTNRPADLASKSRVLRADQWAAYDAIPKVNTSVKEAEFNRLQALQRQDVARFEREPRAKVLFLSATPWAYDKAVDYAEGYLFDYPKDGRIGRSNQSGRNLFMVQHFGYRIRYHKLTQPERGVQSQVFEREFNEMLRRAGVLSGRTLVSETDFDRKFIVKDSPEGRQIDAALELIRDRARGETDQAKAYRALSRHIERTFDTLARAKLLEAIKAKAIKADIGQHLAMGRKVVVFHDYNVGGGFNPLMMRDKVIPTAQAVAAFDHLVSTDPWVKTLDFSDLERPVEALIGLMPGGKKAVRFDGEITDKQRAKNLQDFNTDGSGVDVLVVQSQAGGPGISMHDLTGNHMRVLMNIGLPSRPTIVIQEEGRTRRVGTVTNTPFRYYSIDTAWERMVFASRIAVRADAVENLAMGNAGRNLQQEFIDAFFAAGNYPPSPEDGTGGKATQAQTTNATPFQIAKTHFYGRPQIRGNRNSRDGVEFYPTPEPLGFKMVEWAGIRPGDKVLEPSVGDGAIARYVPEGADLTIVEPSADLLSRAKLRAPEARAEQDTFEDFSIVNKYDVILMNPPFGSGGATAFAHLEKAMNHLRIGGRIVAVVPTGPAADKRWEKVNTGNWSVSVIEMPGVAFSRAGTGVMTRVLIMDKLPLGKDGNADMDVRRDSDSRSMYANMTGSETIENFFDRLEGISAPDRPARPVDPVRQIETEAATGIPGSPQPLGPALDGGVAFKPKPHKHPRTGDPLYVAQKPGSLDDDTYARAKAIATSLNGKWYGKGPVPGFTFTAEANRDQFIAAMAAPTRGLEERAYHGTPHDFDRFSLDKIGTGEGAQAYGWGLYFAGARKVAEQYKRKLSRASLSIDGKPVDLVLLRGGFDPERIKALQDMIAQRPPQKPAEVSDEDWRSAQVLMPYELAKTASALRDKVQHDGDDPKNRLRIYREIGAGQYKGAAERGAAERYEYAAKLTAIDWLSPAVSLNNTPRLFTVEIPDADLLLDWDKPLSDQPEAVKAIIAKMPAAPDPSVWDETTGENFLEQIVIDQMGDAAFMQNSAERSRLRAAARREASIALRAAGIPGHRYLDGDSRNGRFVAYDSRGENVRQNYDSMALSEMLAEEGDRLTQEGILTEEQYDDAMDDVGGWILGITGNEWPTDPGSVALIEELKARGWTFKDEGSHNYVIYDDAAVQVVSKEQLLPERPEVAAAQHVAADTIARMMPALRAELDRLDMGRVRLVHETAGRNWQGQFRVYGDGTMEILIGASLDPEVTLRHEVIHALRSMNLFTPQEWRALSLKAERTWMKEHDIPARYGDLPMEAQIEEAIAEAFGKALRAKQSPKGSALVTAFNKIARFLRALRNVFQGAGFRTAEDVFGDVVAGRIGARLRGAPAVMQQRQPITPLARATASSALGLTPHVPDPRVWRELHENTERLFDGLAEPAMDFSRIDTARVAIQDRFLPVRRAAEAVEREIGHSLPAFMRPYDAEITFSGKAETHLMDIENTFTVPVIRLMAKNKLDPEKVGTFLYARHAIERNARIASINPAMPDGGSGMTDSEANAILQAAAASPEAAVLNDIAQKVDDLRKWMMKLRIDSGLLSPEDAKAWSIYKHYVPLKGWAEADHADAVTHIPQIGSRFSISGRESQRAAGRSTSAFNPLAGMLTQAQELAIRAEKNRVAVRMFNLADAHPSKRLFEVKKPKQKRYFNRTTGMVETRIEQPTEQRVADNEMAVKVGGKEMRIVFADMRIAEAMKNMGADQMGMTERFFAGLMRVWSMMVTSLNPEFLARNLIMDASTGLIQVQSVENGPAIAAGAAANWRKALAGIWRGDKGKFDTTWAKHYREFLEAGAKIAFFQITDPEVNLGGLERRVRLARGNMAVRALKRVTSLEAIFSMKENPALAMMAKLNLVVDNAIRLAAFVKARELGMSKEQAAILAKEMTVNFNRRGAVRWPRYVFPFFNPAVQGTYALAKAMTRKQTWARMATITTGLVVMGLLNDMLNAALSDEDDDGELIYDKIPQYRASRNMDFGWALQLAGVEWEDHRTPSLPMAYGFNIFPYAGQMIGKVMRGAATPEEALGDIGFAIFTAFSPVQEPYPFMLQPAVDMWTNENFFGSPVYPFRYPSEDHLPDSTLMNDRTSWWAKIITETLNDWTGGDKYTPSKLFGGMFDISPVTLDYMARWATGSTGQFWHDNATVMRQMMAGEDVEMQKVPFVSAFSNYVPDWKMRNDYFRAREAVQAAYRTVKDREEAGIKQHSDEERALAGLYQSLLKHEAERRGTKNFRLSQRNPEPDPRRPEQDIYASFRRVYLNRMARLQAMQGQ